VVKCAADDILQYDGWSSARAKYTPNSSVQMGASSQVSQTTYAVASTHVRSMQTRSYLSNLIVVDHKFVTKSLWKVYIQRTES
jgi:hypothetical protein